MKLKQFLRRYKKWSLISKLAFWGFFVGIFSLSITLFTGFMEDELNCQELDDNLKTLLSKKDYEGLTLQLNVKELEIKCPDMFNYYRGALTYGMPGMTIEPSYYFNNISPTSQYYIRGQKKLVFYYSKRFDGDRLTDAILSVSYNIKNNGITHPYSYFLQLICKESISYEDVENIYRQFKRDFSYYYNFKTDEMTLKTNKGQTLVINMVFFYDFWGTLIFLKFRRLEAVFNEKRYNQLSSAIKDFEKFHSDVEKRNKLYFRQLGYDENIYSLMDSQLKQAKNKLADAVNNQQ